MDWKQVNGTMMAGYEAIGEERTGVACTLWLEAWDGMKRLMEESGVETVLELELAYKWSEFPTNWVQDLESELRNAAGPDNETNTHAGVADTSTVDAGFWHRKRIAFCEELIPRMNPEETLIIENCRRAIAEAHADLGDFETAVRLFNEWLALDPDWGWGHVGLADLYLFRRNRTALDLARAIEIMKKALERATVREREDILERLGDAYGASGDAVNMHRCHKESEDLQQREEAKRNPPGSPALHPVAAKPHVHGPDCNHGKDHPVSPQLGRVLQYEMKPGRNDPCPCGSGKKYKKCCGKD